MRRVCEVKLDLHMNIPNPLGRLRPRSQHLYRQLPIFGPIMDAFAQWILERGFSLDTGRADLNAFQRLVPWFMRRRKRAVDDLTSDDVAEARRYYRLRQPLSAAAIGKLGQYLKTQGRLQAGTRKPSTPAQRELAGFAEHLQKERGLAEKTIEGQRKQVQYFLFQRTRTEQIQRIVIRQFDDLAHQRFDLLTRRLIPALQFLVEFHRQIGHQHAL